MAQQSITKPQNRAAFQMSAKATDLEVKDAPYTSPGDYEVLVRNRAVAVNPIDWVLQQLGTGFLFQWLKYPIIMGWDLAGEVVEVGSKVTRFKLGDRVLGMPAGHDEHVNRNAEAAYQLYTILREDMTTPIPDKLSFEAASALPLGAATAACGLFQSDKLNLKRPSMNAPSTGETVLIWGGSSSVGMSAVQLATAAGYDVITTCSPRNFDLVRRLGASQAFDYNSKTVVKDIAEALKTKTLAGTMSIGDGSVDAIMDILCLSKGNKFIAVATKSKIVAPTESLALFKNLYGYVSFNSSLWLKAKARGINYKFIFADTLVHDGVGKAVFADYLPEALAQNRYIVAPEPMVVGQGLEAIQEGLRVQRNGVSAKKVVVTL